MKQVLNEELFRIQEIMGIKKTSINENSQLEENSLISEQGGEIAALLKGASAAGKFEKTGLSAIDNIVRAETESLSKTSKYVTKTYDSLDELAQAIAKKEIASEVAEDIATTIMKKIIKDPDGAKIVGKAWFEDNMASGIKKTLSKINSGANLPPSLPIKTYKDYELIVSKIATGDADVDAALKQSLEDAYGKPLRQAKTDAENAIQEAKKLNDDYDNLRDEVIKKIKKDPDLSTKKVADWFKLYDDKAKKLLKEKGDYDARKFLLEQLQKPSVKSRISKLFSGTAIPNFLGKLFSGRGIIWTVSGSVIIIALVALYYTLDKGGEVIDTATGESYTKIKKVFPITKDASEKLLNSFVSDVSPDELNNLYLKNEGYALSYETSENEALGDIEVLKIETPSKTYVYTFVKDTEAVDKKVTPKENSDSANSSSKSGSAETFETWLSKTTANGGGGGYGDGDYSNKITNEDGSVTVTIGGQSYTAKKDGNGNWNWL